MRILALDVGDRTIGVAMSDSLGQTAQPVTVLTRRTLPQDIATIAQLVTTHAVIRVIVGHPISLRGTPTPQTRKVETFSRALQPALACPVELWDERLTTVEGDRLLRTSGMRRARRRHVVNQVAAQLLLQKVLEVQRTPCP